MLSDIRLVSPPCKLDETCMLSLILAHLLYYVTTWLIDTSEVWTQDILAPRHFHTAAEVFIVQLTLWYQCRNIRTLAKCPDISDSKHFGIRFGHFSTSFGTFWHMCRSVQTIGPSAQPMLWRHGSDELTSYRIIWKLLNWIKNMTYMPANHRWPQETTWDPETIVFNTTHFVWIESQVLGLLIFLTFINDLPDWISSSVCMFADDMKVWYTVKKKDEEQVLRTII